MHSIKKMGIGLIILSSLCLLSSTVFSNQVATRKRTQSTLQNIDIVLRADKDRYDVHVPLGASVYDTMLVLASTTPFRFKATKYPTLGYFITEINGIENSDGTYWTLYINNNYATSGASSIALVGGDEIWWKFEKK